MPGSGFTRAGNAGARPQLVVLARASWAWQEWTHRRDRPRAGRKTRPSVRVWLAQAPAIDGLWVSVQVERRVGVAGYSWRVALVEPDGERKTGAAEVRLLRSGAVVQLRDAGQALAVVLRNARELAAKWLPDAETVQPDTSFSFGGAA